MIKSRQGHGTAVPTGLIHPHLTGLVRPKQSECGQENVQQRAVIRVSDVLDHQLPVRGNELTVVSDHPQTTPADDALVRFPEPLSEVLAKRRRLVTEARPDHPVDDLDLEPQEAMVSRREVPRHSALSLDAAPKRNPLQGSIQRVGPLVIRTGDPVQLAGPGLADLHAAMAATILEDGDLILGATNYNDLPLAERRGAVTADFRNLRFQACVKPMVSIPDPIELGLVNVFVGVHPIRDLSHARAGPALSDGIHALVS